jgi:uncharacterized protein (DUF433 family)
MGVDDTIRFITLLDTPSGDYTRDRHALLKDPSVEELFAEARRREALRHADRKVGSEGSPADIAGRGMRVLQNALGVADMLRFLRQFRSGAPNYTEDREDIPLEEIFAEARRMQNERGMTMSTHSDRIIIDPAQYGGRPFIRGTRIYVQDVLDLLASGYSADDVLEELEELERADVFAVMDYRAQQTGTP